MAEEFVSRVIFCFLSLFFSSWVAEDEEDGERLKVTLMRDYHSVSV